MQAAGFVLVGGRSSRMGQDKARLPMGSGLLVEEIAAKVAQAASRVTLIGPRNGTAISRSNACRICASIWDRLPGLRPRLPPITANSTSSPAVTCRTCRRNGWKKWFSLRGV